MTLATRYATHEVVNHYSVATPKTGKEFPFGSELANESLVLRAGLVEQLS